MIIELTPFIDDPRFIFERKVVFIGDGSFCINELKLLLLYSVLLIVLTFGRIDRVKYDLKHFINHIRHECFRPFVRLTKVWVRIHFD